MATNPMLAPDVVYQPQADMLAQMVIDSIQAKGVDMLYLPREVGDNTDHLLGETPSQSFPKTYCVEMYISEHIGHDGAQDLMSKFGMEFADTAVFQVSVLRFKDVLRPAGIDRPREGDLVYYPQADSVFEVKKVMQDEYFKQLGYNITYRLRCSLYRPSHEAMPDDDIGAFSVGDEGLTDDLLLSRLGINRVVGTDIVEQEGTNAFDPNNPLGE